MLVPAVEVSLLNGVKQEAQVKLKLHNGGTKPVRYTLTATTTSAAQQGYYDVVVTVDTDSTWMQRYAGRIATTGEG